MTTRARPAAAPAPPPLYPTGTTDDALARRARGDVAETTPSPDTRYAIQRLEIEVAAMRAQLDRIEAAVTAPAHRKDRLTRS